MQSTTDLRQIHVDLIDENELNFYGTDNVADLCESIALSGVLQPVIVMEQADGRFLLVAGHRRTKAVRELRKEWNGNGVNPFDTIPAIVKPLPENEMQSLLAELQLIQTNSAARKLNDQEIMRQANRMTEIFYRLKSYGYEFPGRMRETVAKAVGISSAKLGRLKFIVGHLSASWAERWQNGDVAEYAAEALARLPEDRQDILLYLKHPDPERLDKLLRYYDQTHGEPQQCQSTPDRSCTNMEGFWLSSRNQSPWNFCGFGHSEICCSRCNSVRTCTHACKQAQRVREKKDAELDKQRENQAARAQQEADTMFERWEYFRRRAGVTAEELDKAISYWRNAYAEAINETGHAMRNCGPHKYYNFESCYNAAKIMGVPVEALRDPDWEPDDALQICSRNTKVAATSQRSVWIRATGDDLPNDGELVFILRDTGIPEDDLCDWKIDPRCALYHDGKFYHAEKIVQDVEWTSVRYWAPWPEMEK